MEQKPKMRYDDKELGLIKATFADNEELLLVLRKVFLQAELTEGDIKRLAPITKSKVAQALLRKAYAPGLEMEAPFGQVIDLWMSVDTKELDPVQSTLALMVRDEMKNLLEVGLERLAEPTMEVAGGIADYTPDFEGTDEERYVTFIARNSIITHTETRLQELSFLAGKKDESVEETMTRLRADSAK